LAALLLGVCAVGALAAEAAVSSAKSSVPPQDEQYLMTSIQGDRFEIIGGKLAKAKGNSTAVRGLGARLESDHSKSLKESVKLAKKLHVQVPKAPTPPERWELKVVATYSGAAFDRWYSDLEVQDHKQDITEASDERSKGGLHSVRASAAKELPALREHLKLSRAALKVANKE
jgi:predicted outer membrane protein